MDNIVFDTPFLMAILQGETIAMVDLPDLRRASMSAVSVAEVCTVLTQTQEATRRSGFALLRLLREIKPFTEDQARRAGEFRRFGKHVSLGGRACLALAVDLGAAVYTADREWIKFDSGLIIHLIR